MYKRSTNSYLGFSSNDMQINSILKITKKFQTNSEFKVNGLISCHEVYNILHLWWHFLETATSWGGLATSGIYCNVLITELYQKSWLQFFDDFAVKVNKKCNLIKRRWWLHAHFTKKERWLVILYRSGKYGINSVANKRLVFTGNLMKQIRSP